MVFTCLRGLDEGRPKSVGKYSVSIQKALFLIGFMEKMCLSYFNEVSTSVNQRSLGNILLKSGSVPEYLQSSA